MVFFYFHKTYNNNYNTKAKGAWKDIATLKRIINIETQVYKISTKYLATKVIRVVYPILPIVANKFEKKTS